MAESTEVIDYTTKTVYNKNDTAAKNKQVKCRNFAAKNKADIGFD